MTQFETCTSAGPLFGAISSCTQLAQPGITPIDFDIVNEGIPCLDQRGALTVVIPVVPSMLKESIFEIKRRAKPCISPDTINVWLLVSVGADPVSTQPRSGD